MKSKEEIEPLIHSLRQGASGQHPSHLSYYPQHRERTPEWVLYHDNHLLIVNKPVGVVTHEDAIHRDSMRRRASEWLCRLFDKPAAFLTPLHRLDKGTSGCLAFAKTTKALVRANRSQPQWVKRYLSILENRSKVPALMGDHAPNRQEPSRAVWDDLHQRLEYHALILPDRGGCVAGDRGFIDEEGITYKRAITHAQYIARLDQSVIEQPVGGLFLREHSLGEHSVERLLEVPSNHHDRYVTLQKQESFTNRAIASSRPHSDMYDSSMYDSSMNDSGMNASGVGQKESHQKGRRSQRGSLVENASMQSLAPEYIHPAEGEALELWEFELTTGRYHQIRAQASARNMPVVADLKYGSGRLKGGRYADLIDIASQRCGYYLHCYHLCLPHPITQEAITMVAPAPFEDLMLWNCLAHLSLNTH